MFLLMPVDAASQRAEPAADERAHGAAPACDGRNARPYKRTGSSAGKRPPRGEIHRVRIEDLCDGCISLSNGEAFNT